VDLLALLNKNYCGYHKATEEDSDHRTTGRDLEKEIKSRFQHKTEDDF